MPPKKEKKAKKAIATRSILPIVKKSRNDSASTSELFSHNTVNQQTITDINDWRATMQAKPWRVYNYQPYRPSQVVKIPDILKSRAHLGLIGFIEDIPNRKIYGGDFPYSLQQEFLETNIRINNEGKIKFDNNIDNTKRYTENNNNRLDQPSMNLGSKSPPISEEQQRNELMNEGSQRQKQILSRYLNDEFANQEQVTNLEQSSFIDDVQPEFTLAQEKLIEALQQEIEADNIALLNLNTIYDIGDLD
ncbi:MAG: hypothetical protein EZS28_040580 [Streblomastix strix]|uniref:Uncharacterized protein n=1 Tax=Streblomastix strix TaxID=222440 RepID=A0A5J4U0X6_9EUKA|nr:MAG: hypothetical protein EZS28_040580 [Streblomastix strix]